MRIIAGKYGGRVIDSPKNKSTHPMSEKMRGAIFNLLGDIEGLRLFDAYGGSGAIALEAYSRGAIVTVCEINNSAFRCISNNKAKLGVSKGIIAVQASCSTYAATTNNEFDIIICDPPYNDIKWPQISAVASSLAKDGLLLLSFAPSLETDLAELALKKIVTKKHGDAALHVFRKI